MEKIPFKDLPDTSTPFNANTFNTMQDNIEEAINEGNKILVWKNETTSSGSFEAQTINVDLSNCNAISIVFRNHKIYNLYFYPSDLEITNICYAMDCDFSNQTGSEYIRFHRRSIILTNTYIKFGDNVSIKIQDNDISFNMSNNVYLIPSYIYKYTLDTGE